MKVYLVYKDGKAEVCLNLSNALILATKWETEVVEVETVDDYVV